MPLKWPSRPKCDANAGGRLINSVAHRPKPEVHRVRMTSPKRPFNSYADTSPSTLIDNPRLSRKRP